MTRRPLLGEGSTRDIGPCRLAHRIAVGGMAEVYRALLPQAAGGDRSVVIKRLLPELAKDEARRVMFAEEARLGQRIEHDNVVRVLGQGSDEGVPYLMLEYVFGVDLWRLVRWMESKGRELRPSTSIWIVSELLAGLEAVHGVCDERGVPLHVVHRDVSPSNVFLSVHGDVKLGDLGIARPSLRGLRGTAADRAKGKLGYLSPEQVSGRDVDARGDVFATAVILAELLAGARLFSGATEIAVLLAIRDGDVRVFRSIASRLPEGLADIVLAALERRPEHRTSTAGRFRQQLEPFLVEPASQARAELGQLVVASLDDLASSSDRGALARTVEKDGAWFARETPPVDAVEAPTYFVERAGERVAEHRLAELVRALTTGEIKPTDRVSIDGAEPKSVALIPELAGHLPVSARTPTARRRVAVAETGERWDLAQRSTLAVFAELFQTREDGLLLCEDGESRKEVYFEGGVPCFVTSNQPAELFGEALLAQGVIDRAELDLALSAMARFEGRLGETLVALELVDPVDLVAHLAAHAQARLLRLFEWTRGHAALYRELDRPERAFSLDLGAWEVLERGAERLLSVGAFDFGPHMRDGLERVERRPEGAGEEALELWAACVVPRSLQELEDFAPTVERARARVLLLLELGALRWRERG